MKLEELINGAEILRVIGDSRVEITDVTSDSNSVTRGGLFICIKGRDYDGRSFVRQAENYGAAAIITETPTDTALVQAIVKSARKAMSVIAANYYGRACDRLKFIGVTGTNGKTTTTHFITSILACAGIKCGLIGTLGCFYGGKYVEATLTTPDPLELHKTLKEMEEAGVETVVMEISAHAAYLDKLYGLKFEAAAFTNFSQDHLDFFGDMENYKSAKLKFFDENYCKYIVVNADDETGRLISERENAITYGIENPADVFAIDVKRTRDGQRFVINLFDCIYGVELNLGGKFNVYNALAAATVCALCGVNTEKAVEGLENLKGVNGRMEKIYDGEFSVYIDYAHTPDGLKNALIALKPEAKKRLICVFGCGGNRDEKKRALMGEISGEYADFTVITSDNPRYEDPMDIIYEIEKGVLRKTKKYVAVQERAEGIKYAFDYAKKGDVVLIAGKGGEKYQEVFGIKRLYNDKDTVKEITEKCTR